MIFHWKLKQPEFSITNKTIYKAQKMSSVQKFSTCITIRLAMGHLKEEHLLGRLRCHIFPIHSR